MNCNTKFIFVHNLRIGVYRLIFLPFYQTDQENKQINFTISNTLLNVVSVSVYSLCQRETPNAAQSFSQYRKNNGIGQFSRL